MEREVQNPTCTADEGGRCLLPEVASLIAEAREGGVAESSGWALAADLRTQVL